jgi:hypothetical protein
VSFVIDLSKVECISYINNENLEAEGKAIDDEITKFM